MTPANEMTVTTRKAFVKVVHEWVVEVDSETHIPVNRGIGTKDWPVTEQIWPQIKNNEGYTARIETVGFDAVENLPYDLLHTYRNTQHYRKDI